jgi:UrcA family protein
MTNEETTMHTLRIAFLVLAGLSAAGTQAADPAEPQQMEVSYAGLDLTTQAGAEKLYRRIKVAANFVCDGLYTRDLARGRLWQRCISSAVSNAVADVGAPVLTAYHAEQMRKPEKAVAIAAGG